MSFPRYERYKDSGVEWLGEVPEHWQVRSFRHSARIKNGTDFKHIEVEDGGYPVVGSGGPFARVSQFMYDKPSVLLGRKGTIDKPLYMDTPFWAVDTMYYTEIAADSVPKYVFYYSKCIPFDLFTYGSALPSMTQTTLHALGMPVPNLQDQAKIALFLDNETSKIDVLIEEQRRLINLLKEKRQAVVSHAVTKGSSPAGALKASGVKWLGAVPLSWEVLPIKWVARVESGHTPDKKIDSYWEGGDIPWVSLNDTGYLRDHDYIAETAYYTTADGLSNSSARLLPAGAVVFSRDATIGRCAITTRPMAVSQHFIAWICGERILPEFLLKVCDAMQSELERLCTGATIKTIGMTDIGSLVTPLPSLTAQAQIVEHIAACLKQIDTLISESSKARDLLQERRSALISAAVTGKIDVRNYIPKEAA